MKIRLAAPVTKESIVNGPGLRWSFGPRDVLIIAKVVTILKTHSYDGGFEIEVE